MMYPQTFSSSIDSSRSACDLDDSNSDVFLTEAISSFAMILAFSTSAAHLSVNDAIVAWWRASE